MVRGWSRLGFVARQKGVDTFSSPIYIERERTMRDPTERDDPEVSDGKVKFENHEQEVFARRAWSRALLP